MLRRAPQSVHETLAVVDALNFRTKPPIARTRVRGSNCAPEVVAALIRPGTQTVLPWRHATQPCSATAAADMTIARGNVTPVAELLSMGVSVIRDTERSPSRRLRSIPRKSPRRRRGHKISPRGRRRWWAPA